MKSSIFWIKCLRYLIVFPLMAFAFYCMTNSFSELFLALGRPGALRAMYPSFMISLGIVSVAYGLWEIESWFRLKARAKLSPEPEQPERVVIREVRESVHEH